MNFLSVFKRVFHFWHSILEDVRMNMAHSKAKRYE